MFHRKRLVQQEYGNHNTSAPRFLILPQAVPLYFLTTVICFGVLLFREQLTLRLVIGIIVILAAVTIAATGKRISTRFPRFCKKHYFALIRKTR